MPQVVEHLAELTAYRDRDRDVADTTLVAALRDLLLPREVAIYRCVGEGTDRRWLTRGRLALEDVVALADPLYTDLADLPALDVFAARLQALQQAPVAVALSKPGEPHQTVFPLTTDRERVGVLELRTDEALDAAAQRLRTAARHGAGLRLPAGRRHHGVGRRHPVQSRRHPQPAGAHQHRPALSG